MYVCVCVCVCVYIYIYALALLALVSGRQKITKNLAKSVLFYLKAEILKRAEVEILKTGSSSENVSALALLLKTLTI